MVAYISPWRGGVLATHTLGLSDALISTHVAFRHPAPPSASTSQEQGAVPLLLFQGLGRGVPPSLAHRFLQTSVRACFFPACFSVKPLCSWDSVLVSATRCQAPFDGGEGSRYNSLPDHGRSAWRQGLARGPGRLPVSDWPEPHQLLGAVGWCFEPWPWRTSSWRFLLQLVLRP